eukprot:15453866-Alexandrium_andersonii.AAC.1
MLGRVRSQLLSLSAGWVPGHADMERSARAGEGAVGNGVSRDPPALARSPPEGAPAGPPWGGSSEPPALSHEWL